MMRQMKLGPQIAVLDAEPVILHYVQRILDDRFDVKLFSQANELLNWLKISPPPEMLLMDWNTAEDDTKENALGLVAKIHASLPALPIVVLACSVELREVVEATRNGAADVILKPVSKRDIDLAVQQHLKEPGTGRGRKEDDFKEIRIDEETSFVIFSKRMREIESQCRLLARTDIPVLILGESGTGKEVATKLIHELSPRGKCTFLKVNCAAMPADLLESELFGYEQGAFTGAVKSKPGKFEVCNKGTIFLDEIGEMPATLQAKLLQVLQDGTFARLGGRSIVRVDVRVIAATNIDIKAAIAQKAFREDLYYRLNGFTLKMPPLRERIEEIPILSHHFMRKVAAKYEREPMPISPALMQALVNHSWPGNLRELENMIKRYFVMGDERAVMDDLGPAQLVGPYVSDVEDAAGGRGLKSLVRTLKGDAESTAIAQALEATGWNRRVAAVDLQISYKALLYKIKQYNLVPPRRQFSLGLTQRA